LTDIVIFGATGLVGGAVLARFAGRDVVAVGRRAVAGGRAVPVDGWPKVIAEMAPTIVISALGTTIRAAGSQAAFAAVDCDAVLAVARAAKESGARQFVTVSSVGADAAASNFYLKTKGETEAGLRALGFERLDVMRPGLLLGDRDGPMRPMERLAAMLSPLTNVLTPRSLDRYRAIAADDVAAAIVAVVGRREGGMFVHHNREMLELVTRSA
jgi:uncharacterized protein YbjT (DUF2867 family)